MNVGRITQLTLNPFCLLEGHRFEPGPKKGQMHCIHCGKVIQ